MPFPFSGSDLPRLIASAPAIVAGETSTSFVLVEDPPASPEAIGFGQLVRQDRTAFRLARLIIAPSRRGFGFGASLCRLLIEKAESVAQAKRVHLFVYRDNPTAIQVYSKLGFVETPSHSRSDVMAMHKSIGRIKGHAMQYHAHVFFSTDQQNEAEALRTRLLAEVPSGTIVGPVLVRPAGPLPLPSFQLEYDGHALSDVEKALERIRDGHSILIHPVGEDELESHTSLARWLGEPLPLRLDQL